MTTKLDISKDVKQKIMIQVCNEVEMLTKMMKHVDVNLMIEYLQSYINNKISLLNNQQTSTERIQKILIMKLSIYYFFIMVKIITIKSPKMIELLSQRIPKNTDGESLSSESTRKIFRTRNIEFIESYMIWLQNEAFHMDLYEMLYFTIMLKRLCYLKNDMFFTWLEKNYDALPTSIIIIIKKMFIDEECCYNSYFSQRLNMKIADINTIEIALIMFLKLNISEEDIGELLDEIYLENIT